MEGPVLVSEAAAAGWSIEIQYVAPGVVPVDTAGQVVRLATGVAERVSATETPSGLFAVVRRRWLDADALAEASFVVVADRVADPGNLGTIMRSAEAAGVDAVVSTPGTVDVTSPKVVRASAGALFHVPSIAASLEDVTAAGLRVIGTSSHRGDRYDRADWAGRIAIAVGNEAHGLASDAPVETWVRIEHAGRAESLNVAMAATLLCFAAAAARR